MKVHYNELLCKLTSIEEAFSLLNTLADAEVNWHSVPNAELEIIKERVKSLDSLVTELFDRFEKYDKR
jgi:hypothetical protein